MTSSTKQPQDSASHTGSNAVDACNARWREAQRSPSIIGFNVASGLSDKLSFRVDGETIVAADIRLWEGTDGEGSDNKVFLEVLFPGVSFDLNNSDEKRFADACVQAIEVHLREQRVTEFRERLAKHNENASTLRRRGGGAQQLEGGDTEQESWKDFLSKPASDSELRVHRVVDIGGRGRRVLACQLSMTAGAAEELGRLAYPRLFGPSDEDEEDNSFLVCYYGCFAFILLLALLWAVMLVRGLLKTKKVVLGPL